MCMFSHSTMKSSVTEHCGVQDACETSTSGIKGEPLCYGDVTEMQPFRTEVTGHI